MNSRSVADNKFVFVVCGARGHIETLHFSLAALKQYTGVEILVITDTGRNEIPVVHDNVVNVTTPAHFDNHQASIYLKTGLHRFLPGGKIYCYLDTDVIAISKEVDAVFNQKQGAITFAADHCSLRQFSPHAVHCNCVAQNKNDHAAIQQLLVQYGYNPPVPNAAQLQKQKRLQQKLEWVKRNKGKLFSMASRYLLSANIFKLDDDNFYNRAQNFWFDADGTPFLYEVPKATIKQVEKNSPWRWNSLKRRWISPEENDIQLLACGHLKEAIAKNFKVDIDGQWQHWNGGVFLFDDASHEFMEKWHQNTLAIFEDPYWKTRDQGTLIATAWQLGFQHLPLLSKKFNFIAYFYNPALMLNAGKTAISDDALATQIEPALIHVFEHFGDEQWDIWNWVVGKNG